MFRRVFWLGGAIAASACTYEFKPGPPPGGDGGVDAAASDQDGGTCESLRSALAEARARASACNPTASSSGVCTDSDEGASDECDCPISVNRTQAGGYSEAKRSYVNAGCRTASCPACPFAGGIAFGVCGSDGSCTLE